MNSNLPAVPTMTADNLRGAVTDIINDLDATWIKNGAVRIVDAGDGYPGTDGPTVTVITDRITAGLIRTALRNGTLTADRLYARDRIVVAQRTAGTRAADQQRVATRKAQFLARAQFPAL
ncbi:MULTISPECIES: hypothetical protein [unclassified Streptomyces]|uniref:hypothetical protein n=1 Tax=unclassified Streptomyces TaxID=2593676 RepID=UPI00081B3D6D|nr:hypothetical protein [Streptomyces sp. BvitLS-983]MYX88420.1 hypothetical protein [Streptomyces sp. SID4915]SCE16586.1 hypothetical protein GA0115250_144749 [Streptomyces sp. BvitLS-983]